MFKFPQGFFWGAATSAYQVEGGNANSDWWEWEQRAGLKEVSGLACRHYELYARDFDLAKGLNHNCHRFSLEWSRIQPREGEFSELELQHYREVIRALRQRGLEPVVTLHHFTNPIWFARQGGWVSPRAPEYFLRFVEKAAGALAPEARFWVTINEPMVYCFHSYILGNWPPQEKSFFKAAKVAENFYRAHLEAYRMLHRIYRDRGLPSPLVGIAHNLQAFEACVPTLRNKFAAYLRSQSYNFSFLKKLVRRRAMDFIGVNYYTRGLAETKSWRLSSLLLDDCQGGHSRLRKNSLGWDIYPQGLYRILLELKKFRLPIFILENGICTDDDNLRWEFISEHLKALAQAMLAGADVLGYIYWSLIDNYEWDKGFGPRFGLIGVDYRTYERTPRESAKKFSQVSKTGVLA